MRSGARSPTLTSSGLTHLCSHQQGHLCCAAQTKCKARFSVCCCLSRGQLPHHLSLLPSSCLFRYASFHRTQTILPLFLSPILTLLFLCWLLIVRTWLVLHNTKWACVFFLESWVDVHRPWCGYYCPSQVTLMLGWAMLLHHKDHHNAQLPVVYGAWWAPFWCVLLSSAHPGYMDWDGAKCWILCKVSHYTFLLHNSWAFI